jgi:hypothetical protein
MFYHDLFQGGAISLERREKIHVQLIEGMLLEKNGLRDLYFDG